jgi:hypothetical protein
LAKAGCHVDFKRREGLERRRIIGIATIATRDQSPLNSGYDEFEAMVVPTIGGVTDEVNADVKETSRPKRAVPVQRAGVGVFALPPKPAPIPRQSEAAD